MSSLAHAQHVTACSRCEEVQPASNVRCVMCGHVLHVRHENHLQRCWSLLLTGVIFYFPANLLPIMRTTQLGGETETTIVGGVLLLWEHGSTFIAAIIFIASLVVPLFKILAIAGLCLSHHWRAMLSAGQKTRVYRITEFVGRWSMVDVFVVGFLAALIQMGSLMSIQPGPAALAFGGMVIFTMLAANSIDTRYFWDEETALHD